MSDIVGKDHTAVIAVISCQDGLREWWLESEEQEGKEERCFCKRILMLGAPNPKLGENCEEENGHYVGWVGLARSHADR